MVQNRRIVVAMSGGVDSSVAAALLLESGHEVIGLMLRLWSEPGHNSDNRCCNPDSITSARETAHTLGIPFYVVDAKMEFYHHVVEYFINGYKSGVTPNPCLACNRMIRWGLLLEKAEQMGADHLATGHYARTIKTNKNKYSLLRGIDSTKDQSYVLHVLSQRQLAKSKFPIGGKTKDQVRKLALDFGLPEFNRKESQDLCFTGNETYQSFLMHQVPSLNKPGPMITSNGKEVGAHKGLAFYTIGQRKGLGISASTPMYVIKKHISTNTIVLGSRDDLARKSFNIDNVNWIPGGSIKNGYECTVQNRYRSSDTPCTLTLRPDGTVQVMLKYKITDVTPGQAAVFYNGDTCLGGGIIQR